MDSDFMFEGVPVIQFTWTARPLKNVFAGIEHQRS
jgi:hypothetical protein